MKQEIWECNLCADEGTYCPCRVTINYETTKYEHDEKQSRFRSRGCLCHRESTPEWKKISDEESSEEYIKKIVEKGTFSEETTKRIIETHILGRELLSFIDRIRKGF